MTCELRMAVGGLGTVAPLLTLLRRLPALLPRLVYLMLCRSIQLLALLARGDAAKDLEILVLRHQLTVLRRQISRPRFETADRALLAAVSRAMPRACWSCFLVKPETLLRRHRRLIARAWSYSHHQTGPTTAGQGPATAGYPPGQREPSLGLPAHQGRTTAPRRPGVGHHDPHNHASSRVGSGAPASDPERSPRPSTVASIATSATA